MTDLRAGVAALNALLALMPPDDAALVAAILDAEPERAALLIRAYYRDLDRAERTPRGVLYLHIGWLLGRIEQLQDDARGHRDDDSDEPQGSVM